MTAAMHINTEQFKTEVLQSEVPVLVDFYAEWCGPCKALGPVLDRLSGELAGQAKIVKVDVDENPELAVHFRVSSVPTMLLFRDGQLVQRLVGLRNSAELRDLLTAAA